MRNWRWALFISFKKFLEKKTNWEEFNVTSLGKNKVKKWRTFRGETKTVEVWFNVNFDVVGVNNTSASKMGSTDNFCLRWNDFEANIVASFQELRQDAELFDVTLCCDDGKDVVQAHKVVLAACSPLFRRILAHNQNQPNPLLYLKGVSFDDLNSVLNFMYHGEVVV